MDIQVPILLVAQHCRLHFHKVSYNKNMTREQKQHIIRDHSLSTYSKFSEKKQNILMLVFSKILRTY